MKFNSAGARTGATALAAFLGGLLIAGGFEMTPFSHAQAPGARSAVTIPVSSSVTDLSNSFAAIAEAVTPAVVSIKSESPTAARPVRQQRPQQQRPPQQPPQQQQPPRQQLPPGFEDFFELPPGFGSPQEAPVATGTGFIVSADGYILTNNHVVTRSNRVTRQDRVTVTLNDGRVFPAKIVGNDAETDVAVLKIEANQLPVTNLGDDNSTRIGEWVVAIGNPLGLNFTVTAGIVSAKGRNESGLNQSRYAISDFIQTDAAINPGNSGGPLINIKGEVIGINSAIASSSGYFQGYGFAIPITLAHDIMSDLIEYGRIRAAILGVSIANVDPDDAIAAGLKTIAGVRVSSFPDSGSSPAHRAGVQMNDVILEVDGKVMDRVGTLQRTIRSYNPGTTIELKVMRNGSPQTIRVRLEERMETASATSATSAPTNEAHEMTFEKLGVSVETVTPQSLREDGLASGGVEGLRVTDVAPGRSSSEKLRGMIITEVERPGPRKTIRSEADLEAVLARVRDGDVITVRARGLERGRDGRPTLSAPLTLNIRVGQQ